MDITDFKIQAHKICDRWYFKNTEDALEMWERPYLRGPGYEKDYMVVSFPFEILCNVEERSAHLTAKLQGLRYNHEKRMRGKQVEEVAGMLSEMNSENKSGRLRLKIRPRLSSRTQGNCGGRLAKKLME